MLLKKFKFILTPIVIAFLKDSSFIPTFWLELVWFYSSMQIIFRSCASFVKTYSDWLLIDSGICEIISSRFMLFTPLWSEQKWPSSQASASPQSQHPPTFLFSWIRCPVWSPFSKQDWQIIQVGSFSQSRHRQATSP